MVTVICQHSGIEFEANSRRTKQHPQIAALKDWGMKNDMYREVNRALDEAQKRGGYTTIDEYMTLVNEILDGVKGKQAAIINARAAAAKQERIEREARQAKRDEQNRILKANGYRWQKIEVGTEGPGTYGAGIGEFDHYEWTLYAPDGHEVSVEQALDEITRGAEVVRAEREEARRIEENETYLKELEAEREKNRERNILDEFDRQRHIIENSTTPVQRFDYRFADTTVIARPNFGDLWIRSHYRRHDEVRLVNINDVACYIVITGTGYDNDGYYSYYSADPEKAGLVRTDKPVTASTFLGIRQTKTADQDYF